jgi:hypothetical protein
MKHQVAAATPKCFENWCHRFDNVFFRQVKNIPNKNCSKDKAGLPAVPRSWSAHRYWGDRGTLPLFG